MFNSVFATGPTAGGIIPLVESYFPEVAYDSWVTIGLEYAPTGAERWTFLHCKAMRSLSCKTSLQDRLQTEKGLWSMTNWEVRGTCLLERPMAMLVMICGCS